MEEFQAAPADIQTISLRVYESDEAGALHRASKAESIIHLAGPIFAVPAPGASTCSPEHKRIWLFVSADFFRFCVLFTDRYQPPVPRLLRSFYDDEMRQLLHLAQHEADSIRVLDFTLTTLQKPRPDDGSPDYLACFLVEFLNKFAEAIDREEQIKYQAIERLGDGWVKRIKQVATQADLLLAQRPALDLRSRDKLRTALMQLPVDASGRRISADEVTLYFMCRRVNMSDTHYGEHWHWRREDDAANRRREIGPTRRCGLHIHYRDSHAHGASAATASASAAGGSSVPPRLQPDWVNFYDTEPALPPFTVARATVAAASSASFAAAAASSSARAAPSAVESHASHHRDAYPDAASKKFLRADLQYGTISDAATRTALDALLHLCDRAIVESTKKGLKRHRWMRRWRDEPERWDMQRSLRDIYLRRTLAIEHLLDQIEETLKREESGDLPRQPPPRIRAPDELYTD